jgi:ATP adenylyltransferase
MKNCRLCSKFRDREYWNEPLFESPNFIVLPSLGALVEGWLLLLPKDHFICAGALPEHLVPEMEKLKMTVLSLLRRRYGKALAFEHGPHTANLQLGCGVDHAHLHLVPLSFNLASAVNPFLPEGVKWRPDSGQERRTAFLADQDYLYLEQPSGNAVIATHDDFGGQLFRRAIATTLGFPGQFNWRDYSHLTNVQATIRSIKALATGTSSCSKKSEQAA